MVQRKIISEWAHSDQLRAMMFKNSLWSSKPRQQLRAKMYLKDIFISSSWFIISNIAMTIERCYHKIALNECWEDAPHPPRLTVGPSDLKLKCALHHMSMGDKSNIIDEAETLLFTIWLDELRRTYWERNWAYNDELFTAKYEMQVWMTWQFHESGWLHILEGYISTKVEFITDWQSWLVLVRCA